MSRFAILGAAVAAFALLGIAPGRTSPNLNDRVFEMRTYHAAPGKFEAMHKRFRDHTVALFKKHGMTSIGYWVPQDEKDGKGKTLVYVLAHESREAAKKSWAAFSADPEWNRVKSESEKDGKLVDKVESVYLDPTDYSPIK
jgi:hypothetical protein